VTAIRFENVEKRFGGTPVISELTLKIEHSEFFTFVGPSGCGKSTLLNLIAGIEKTTCGDIFFDDMRVNDLAPGARDIAMVFQSYALYPHMTVAQNLAFPLTLKKLPKREIDGQVLEIARLLGLEPLLGRKPKELSGGQRQRVAVGRALVRKPRAFLLDEPLSNLDARLRLETREELKRIHRLFGITTVYVTHDQEEAMALSDRIAVLDRGQIQQCDSPERIYTGPATLFVAQFVGSPPMNLIGAHRLR
jgi:multiple sugar transport system ATP-binding protein